MHGDSEIPYMTSDYFSEMGLWSWRGAKASRSSLLAKATILGQSSSKVKRLRGVKSIKIRKDENNKVLFLIFDVKLKTQRDRRYFMKIDYQTWCESKLRWAPPRSGVASGGQELWETKWATFENDHCDFVRDRSSQKHGNHHKIQITDCTSCTYFKVAFDPHSPNQFRVQVNQRNLPFNQTPPSDSDNHLVPKI